MAATATTSVTQPIYFISHGSPTLFDDESNPAHQYLKKLQDRLPAKPKALVVISAHWEAPQVTVTSSTKLIYDFYGFPAHMYKATWDVSEDPELAQRIVEIVQTVYPDATYDAKRGIDHGVWSPLKIAYPDGGIPVVQVSLHQNLDLNYHLKLGEALRPLAAENVLIIASGGSTHNLRAMRGNQEKWAPVFEKFVADTAAIENVEERNEVYASAVKRSDFRSAHPTAEHYAPLLVAAGAALGPAKVEHFTWLSPNFGMTQIRFEAFKPESTAQL